MEIFFITKKPQICRLAIRLMWAKGEKREIATRNAGKKRRARLMFLVAVSYGSQESEALRRSWLRVEKTTVWNKC